MFRGQTEWDWSVRGFVATEMRFGIVVARHTLRGAVKDGKFDGKSRSMLARSLDGDINGGNVFTQVAREMDGPVVTATGKLAKCLDQRCGCCKSEQAGV